MVTNTVQLPKFKCKRCGHEWHPRKPGRLPVCCGKCKSPYWNEDRAATRPARKAVQK